MPKLFSIFFEHESVELQANDEPSRINFILIKMYVKYCKKNVLVNQLIYL